MRKLITVFFVLLLSGCAIHPQTYYGNPGTYYQPEPFVYQPFYAHPYYGHHQHW
jgi:hypothetical protein